jgi:hypothetical protein
MTYCRFCLHRPAEDEVVHVPACDGCHSYVEYEESDTWREGLVNLARYYRWRRGDIAA